MPIKIIFKSGLAQTFIVNLETKVVDFYKFTQNEFGPIKKLIFL